MMSLRRLGHLTGEGLETGELGRTTSESPGSTKEHVEEGDAALTFSQMRIDEGIQQDDISCPRRPKRMRRRRSPASGE